MWLVLLTVCVTSILTVGSAGLLISDPSLSLLNYKDCGSTAYVSQFAVSNCVDEPCIFAKGSPYTIVVFGILQTPEATSLPFTVTAWKWGLVSFELFSGDGCQFLTSGKCPLQFGDPFQFTINITPADSLPSLSILVEAQMKDENGEMIICGDLDVAID